MFNLHRLLNLSRENIPDFVPFEGVIICFNQLCPQRLKYQRTSMNRRGNASKNIGLTGFCKLISIDPYHLLI
jgi:hypothetical protein